MTKIVYMGWHIINTGSFIIFWDLYNGCHKEKFIIFPDGRRTSVYSTVEGCSHYIDENTITQGILLVS